MPGLDHARKRVSPHEAQNLAAWGASPLHKDVFVEVDWVGAPGASPIIRPADVLRTAAYYTSSSAFPNLSGATAAEAANPDGRDGIAVHFDIGQPTPLGRFDMPYGDWGGGGDRLPVGTDYPPSYSDDMRAIRRAAFRHAVAYPAIGGGQGGVLGASLGYGARGGNAAARSLAHELGHNLGLSHFGVRAWGAMNCKPTYQSVMNYAYASFGFSHQNSNPLVLNPANVSEIRGLYPSDSSLMSASPWVFDVTGVGSVDWNRNGQYDTTRIKAPIAENVFYNGCGTFAVAEKRQAIVHLADKSLPSPVAAHEPALVAMGHRMYALWEGASDGLLHYSSAPLGRAEWDDCVAGANGVRGDQISLGPANTTPACNRWSPERTLSMRGTHLSAVAWRGRIYVAWSNVGARSYSVTRLRERPRLFGYGQSGELFIDGLSHTFPRGRYAWPTIGVIHVDAARHHGRSEILAIFYQRWLNQYGGWMYSEDGSTWRDHGMVVDETGAPIQHSLPPTLASIPNGETCAVFPVEGVGWGLNPHLEFYCFDRTTERFRASRPTNPEGSRNSPFGANPLWTSLARPSLAYHVYRDDLGRPLHGDPSEGQFVLSYIATASSNATRSGPLSPRIFFSRPLSSSSDPFSDVIFPRSQHHHLSNGDARTMGHVGVVLFEDSFVHSLKGLWLHGNKKEGNYKDLEFFPSIDATYSVDLGTGNDFVELEHRLCVGINAARDRYMTHESSSAMWTPQTTSPVQSVFCPRP